ncbi:MAG: RES family NAD+ phosphorylase [Cyanobacteria bacterium TGS_CYA1]|nr:RES family NAD+ phosphorylase [Cyanobacteria bacterium TGS_CYA1]
MIVFRQTNSRYPFLWETASQPAARYNAENDGPAQYFADTVDGAWAEFIRHAEITDPQELLEVRRALWCIDLPDEEYTQVALSIEKTTGDKSSYSDCQRYARSLRDSGVTRFLAPSAAIIRDQAGGYRVEDGLKRGIPKSGNIYIVFDLLPTAPGWRAALAGPPIEILNLTNQF